MPRSQSTTPPPVSRGSQRRSRAGDRLFLKNSLDSSAAMHSERVPLLLVFALALSIMHPMACLGEPVESGPIGGDETARKLFVVPSIPVCPAANCTPTQPALAGLWVEGRSTRSSQAEGLVTLGWTVGTGSPNSQKPAVYIGALQTPGGGSTWTLNTDIVRGASPGGRNSYAGMSGSGIPETVAGSVGLHNSTIGYELDFSNWDADGGYGEGPFTVGLYLHNSSTFASSAAFYMDAAPTTQAYAWHRGLEWAGARLIKDATFSDDTGSDTSLRIAGTHFAALSTTNSKLKYAVITQAGQAICLAGFHACLVGAADGSIRYIRRLSPQDVDSGVTGDLPGRKSSMTAYGLSPDALIGGDAAERFTPKSSHALCHAGEAAWDISFEYRCMAENHWQRYRREEF